MGSKYVFRDSQELYFVSFATVNWIDVFVRREYFDIVVDSIKYCIEKKGLELYAWCIMSSHVHMIISSETENLLNIIRDMKRHTSKTLLKAITENNKESRRWMFRRAGQRNANNETYQFWQQNNHPIALSTKDMEEQRLDYLHNNPVEAGLVDEPHKNFYSSGIDYSGGKGLIEIIYAR